MTEPSLSEPELATHPETERVMPKIPLAPLTSVVPNGQRISYLTAAAFAADSFSITVLSEVCVLVSLLCLTLCDPMDSSPPGSSVHGILQARMLEWVAIPFFRGSSRPRDQPQVSCIAGRFFTV